MIFYTVGLREAYDEYISQAERGDWPTPSVMKIGQDRNLRWNAEGTATGPDETGPPYEGGIIFRSREFAEQCIREEGYFNYAVYGVLCETGEVLDVKRALGDMTEENPAQFGITPEEVAAVKAAWPDIDDWCDFLRYEAQKKGWVRLGTDLEHPYIWGFLPAS